MKRTPIIILALVIIAIGLVLQVQQIRSENTQHEVVIATQMISPLQKITSSDVRIEHAPASDIPNYSISSISGVVGHVSQETIFPGEMVLQPMLAGSSAYAFKYDLGPGESIIALPDTQSIIGFTSPGDHIKALGIAGGATTATVIVSDVKVLSVSGQSSAQSGILNNLTSLGQSGGSGGSVLVEVNDRQASSIFWYAINGHIMYEVRG